MAIAVEYLAIFRRTDAFCNSAASFNRLLQVDSNIVLTNGVIHFQGRPTCNYQITGGQIVAKNQRYFQLRFTWDNDPAAVSNELNHFISLLKAVRGVIAQADGEVETLWDDVSSHFSRQAYPLIHEIENLMRRLIANFMLINVGLEWATEALPNAVEDALRKSKRKDTSDSSESKAKGRDYLNVLHSLDFIHLGDILFSPYSKKTPEELYARLSGAKSPEDIGALKEFIPQSNWQRFFRKYVECEDSYLESRWKKLYLLRCRVAHNAMMTGRDLDDTRTLIGEVRPKLVDAIDKITAVTVPPEDAELVAESAARNVNAAVGEFIDTWQRLAATVELRANATEGDLPRPGILTSFRTLQDLGVFADDQLVEYERLRRLRNQIVHGPASGVPIEMMQTATTELRRLKESVEFSNDVRIVTFRPGSRPAWQRLDSGNSTVLGFAAKGRVLAAWGVVRSTPENGECRIWVREQQHEWNLRAVSVKNPCIPQAEGFQALIVDGQCVYLVVVADDRSTAGKSAYLANVTFAGQESINALAANVHSPRHSAIAIGPDGRVAVYLGPWEPNVNGNAATWVREPGGESLHHITPRTDFPGPIAFDRDGTVHQATVHAIVSENVERRELHYRSKSTSGQWCEFVIDSTSALMSGHIDLALTPSGTPVILGSSADARSLVVYHKSDATTFRRQEISLAPDAAVRGSTAIDVSASKQIFFDDAGSAHIAVLTTDRVLYFLLNQDWQITERRGFSANRFLGMGADSAGCVVIAMQ